MKNNKALILAMSAGIIASTAAETAYADEIIKNPRLDDDIKLEDESKDQVNTENFFKEEIADTEAEEIKEEPTDVDIYPPELATIYSELEEEAKIEENLTTTAEEDTSVEVSEVETTETTPTPAEAEPEPDTPIEEENQPAAEDETANPTAPVEESQPVEDAGEPAPAENTTEDPRMEGISPAETSEDDLQWNNDWNLENVKIDNITAREDTYEVIGKRKDENYPYNYLNKKYGSDPEFQNRLIEAVLSIPDEVINSLPPGKERDSLKKLINSIKSWQSEGLEGYHGGSFENTLSAMRDIIGDRSLIDYIKTDYYVEDVDITYDQNMDVGEIKVENPGSQGYTKSVITEGFPSSFFKIGKYFTSEEIRQLVEKNNQYDFQKVSEILLSKLTDEQIIEIFKGGGIKPRYKYFDAIDPDTGDKDTTHADINDIITKEKFKKDAVAKKVLLGSNGVEYVDLYGGDLAFALQSESGDADDKGIHKSEDHANDLTSDDIFVHGFINGESLTEEVLDLNNQDLSSDQSNDKGIHKSEDHENDLTSDDIFAHGFINGESLTEEVLDLNNQDLSSDQSNDKGIHKSENHENDLTSDDIFAHGFINGESLTEEVLDLNNQDLSSDDSEEDVHKSENHENDLKSEDIEWIPELLVDLNENEYPELEELTPYDIDWQSEDSEEDVEDGTSNLGELFNNPEYDPNKDELTVDDLYQNSEFKVTEELEENEVFNPNEEELNPDDIEWIKEKPEETPELNISDLEENPIFNPNAEELTAENIEWHPDVIESLEDNPYPELEELTADVIDWIPELIVEVEGNPYPSDPEEAITIDDLLNDTESVGEDNREESNQETPEDIPNPADGESWADDDRALNDYVISDDEELSSEDIEWIEDEEDTTNLGELGKNPSYNPNTEELTADDLFKSGEFKKEEAEDIPNPADGESWADDDRALNDYVISDDEELSSEDIEWIEDEEDTTNLGELGKNLSYNPNTEELTADDLFKSGEFKKEEAEDIPNPADGESWADDDRELNDYVITDDDEATAEEVKWIEDDNTNIVDLPENQLYDPNKEELTADDLFKSGEFTRDESIVRPNPIDDKNKLELEFWIEDNAKGINKTDLTADDLFKAGEFSREIPESNLLENNEVGFLTREAALAAGIILRNSQGLKGLYDVTAARGANDRWFYTLVAKSLEDEKPSNPIIETDQTKALREAKREFQNNVLALNNLTEAEIREFIVKIQGAKTYRQVIDAYRQAVELNTLRGINTNKPINPNIPTIEDSIETQIRRAFQENILKLNKLTADEIRYYVLAIQTAKTYEQAIVLYNQAVALNASRSISPEAPRDALSSIREVYKNRLATLTKLSAEERIAYAHRMNLATDEKTLESIFLEALVRNNWTTLRPEITPNPILPQTHSYERVVEVKTPDIVYVSTGFDYIKEGFHSFEELEKLRQQLEESIAENKALIETFKKTIKEAEESLNDVIGRLEKVVEKSENLLKDGQKSIKELETVLAKQKEISSKIEQKQSKNEKEKTVKTATVAKADDSVKPSKTKAQKLAVESTTIYNKAPKAGRKQALRASSQKGYRVPANTGSNPQTGVASVGTVATTMAVAMGSMFAIKKRKEK